MRLRALREDHGSWRLPQDTGQFSLAGAQPKTALLFLKKRWGDQRGFSLGSELAIRTESMDSSRLLELARISEQRQQRHSPSRGVLSE